MDEPYVEVSVAGDIATLTMNRPQRRNALSHDMLRALVKAFEAVAGSDARGVVLAGHGPVFSAGHDFADMAERDLEGMRRLLGTCTELMLTVQRLPQPVVARVQGLATAAGCQLVASCDLAVASSDARFATPGVNIGLFCSTPMVPITRSIGRKRALEMLLTGEMIDARTAADWGLVNRVVPAGELDAATAALAERIAHASPYVVALGKRTFYAQDALDESAAYGIAAPVMAQNAQHDDALEGMTAFLEKRAPTWREP